MQTGGSSFGLVISFTTRLLRTTPFALSPRGSTPKPSDEENIDLTSEAEQESATASTSGQAIEVAEYRPISSSCTWPF